MSQVKVTDEWLYKYMPLADERMIQVLEEKADADDSFSEEFKRAMKKLIQKERRMSRMKTIQKVCRKAAAILLVGLGICFGAVMSVEANRGAFFKTIETLWKDRINYTYHINVEETSLEPMAPTYIPEGYREISRDVSALVLLIDYENENGEIIMYDQHLVTDGYSMVVDSEYDRQEERTLDGGRAVLSLYDDGFIFAYYESGRYVYLLSADHISAEEMYAILESIEKE